ncbi:two-component response regulator 24-like [Typha latifolia]|uniref:two-component response regulator 24-like n=1 Tax=Typha latifolia TaxID=4733 RepID=UPI003C2DCF27
MASKVESSISKAISVLMPEDNLHETKIPLRALIVDDNRIERMMHTVLLRRFQVETTEAENGKDAVDHLVEGKTFDIILMDKDMPVMDGPEATRILRAMGFRAKIVGITADDSAEGKKAFMEAGLDEFLIKPLTVTKLTPLIQDLVPKVDSKNNVCDNKLE